MRLNSIQIAGWRSYAPAKPAALTDLGHINLIIGPNNAGKSNLQRAFQGIIDALTRHNALSDSTRLAGGVGNLFTEHDSWLRKRDPFTLQADIDISDETIPSRLAPLGTSISLKCTTTFGRPATASQGTEPQSETVFCVDVPGEEAASLRSDSSTMSDVVRFVVNLIADRTLVIHALRDPTRVAPDSSRANATNGGDTMARLRRLHGDTGRWDEFALKMGQWLQEILGEQQPPIFSMGGVNSGADEVRITFTAPARLPLSLGSMGSGLVECVTLLTFLWDTRHESQGRLVLVDEPEAHLHPGAAVALVQIIDRDFPRHQAIVTTHSTSLLDAMSSDWRLFKATRGDGGETKISPLDTTEAKLVLLDELGLRPSQMFVANAIVWVEGPSDAIYIQHLLAGLDRAVQRGRDYDFVFYGGATLAHVGVDDDDSLVRCTRIAPRSIFVCDRDSINGKQKKRVRRLREEASRHPGNVYVNDTPGYEIEYLVRQEVLAAAIKLALGVPAVNKTRLLGREPFAKEAARASSRTAPRTLTERVLKSKVHIARSVVASEGDVFIPAAIEFGKKLIEQLRSRVLCANAERLAGGAPACAPAHRRRDPLAAPGNSNCTPPATKISRGTAPTSQPTRPGSLPGRGTSFRSS